MHKMMGEKKSARAKNETLRIWSMWCFLFNSISTVLHFSIYILCTVCWVRFTEKLKFIRILWRHGIKKRIFIFCLIDFEASRIATQLEENGNWGVFFYRIPGINIRLHLKRQRIFHSVIFIDHRTVTWQFKLFNWTATSYQRWYWILYFAEPLCNYPISWVTSILVSVIRLFYLLLLLWFVFSFFAQIIMKLLLVFWWNYGSSHEVKHLKLSN